MDRYNDISRVPRCQQLYRPRRWPQKWVWLHDSRADPGLAERDPARYPLIACLRSVPAALDLARALGIPDPIVRCHMPYARSLCRLQWQRDHPAAPPSRRNRRPQLSKGL